jgi:hypothetical protein
MRKALIPAVVLLLSWAVWAAGASVENLYEMAGAGDWSGPIDSLVVSELERRGIEPARPCSDEVFVRRVYLDVIGTLPQPHEVRAFMADRSADKRSRLIDELLERDEFADYWSLKLCDLLRVKAEFPINLWPNAVQAYHRWIRDAISNDMPWDEFAVELLTSSGSNFRVPQVNFYRAVQGSGSSAIASAVALTFMGVRVDGWTDDRRAGMEAFFSRVAYKETAEWKEEIVLNDPAPAGPVHAVFPDGTRVRIEAGYDPRRVFALWLVSPDNRWFARNIANRIWSWLMGRGLIHEPDDIRPDNPAVHPEVLELLEEELIRAGFDLRHIYRLILGSATYQQSSIPRSSDADAALLFACYPVRRLDAEVLIDALSWVFTSEEGYSSRIPEPFTFVPERERSISLADGSITSQFLEMFGRPARDTGLESERNNRPTEAQRLHLLNSTQIQKMIEGSPWLRDLYRSSRRNGRDVVAAMYLRILSRRPTAGEIDGALDYLRVSGLEPQQAANDLSWALVNTKEFLYRH